MIKKIITKKIIIASVALFALTLFCIFPNKTENLKDLEQDLEYVDNELRQHDIFLMDNNNYLALTKVVIENNNIVDIAKELLDVLIIGGPGESIIPNGFKSIIPNGTKIHSVTYDNKILKVDFNNEFLNVKEEFEDKVIESIVFTLTSIDDVEKVILYSDGQILSKLPQSGKIMPSTYDRNYGINKKYNISDIKNINSTTVYYINEHNGNYYYVPVTNYLNDTRDKISIIIDELSNNFMYTNNLMSFLNEDVQLLKSEIKNDEMVLEFNDAIFNSIDERMILEEVIYTIVLSVGDNYNVSAVSFNFENQEILKKTIE